MCNTKLLSPSHILYTSATRRPCFFIYFKAGCNTLLDKGITPCPSYTKSPAIFKIARLLPYMRILSIRYAYRKSYATTTGKIATIPPYFQNFTAEFWERRWDLLLNILKFHTLEQNSIFKSIKKVRKIKKKPQKPQVFKVFLVEISGIEPLTS